MRILNVVCRGQEGLNLVSHWEGRAPDPGAHDLSQRLARCQWWCGRGGLFDSSHRGNREARPSAAEPDTPSIASLFTGVETEAQNGAVPQRLGPRCCRQLDRGRWAATRRFSSLGCWPLPVPCCFRVTVFSSLIPEGFFPHPVSLPLPSPPCRV